SGNTEKHAGDEPGSHKRGGNTDGYPEQRQGVRFSHYHPENIFPLCSQSDADTYFTGAASNRIRHESIQANACKQHHKKRKEPGEHGGNPFLRQLLSHHVSNCFRPKRIFAAARLSLMTHRFGKPFRGFGQRLAKLARTAIASSWRPPPVG